MPVAYQYLPVGFYGAAERKKMSCAGRKLVFSASIVALMLISPDFSFIMYNTKGFILRSFLFMKLNAILFYTYEGRNYTLYFSSDHMFKKNLSLFRFCNL